MDNLEKLKDIIVEKLGIERKDINLTSNFKNDLGADSLDTVELVMEIDKEFKINIPDEEMEKILTVKDALDLIEKRVFA